MAYVPNIPNDRNTSPNKNHQHILIQTDHTQLVVSIILLGILIQCVCNKIVLWKNEVCFCYVSGILLVLQVLAVVRRIGVCIDLSPMIFKIESPDKRAVKFFRIKKQS